MKFHENSTYLSDLDIAINHSVNIERLKNTSILITGASGTIGSFITDMLIRYNKEYKACIKICIAGRNIDKLMYQFQDWNESDLVYVNYDVMNPITFDISVDYIIHAAGNAHPSAFNGDPVGTIIGNINGTYNLLEYGRSHKMKRFLYVSSGEVYGQGDISLDEYEENYAGYVDISSSRSCYPSSKRAAENLCASYGNQYNIETVVVRPCHTYGPVITPSDNRANVQFIRNVLKNEDIVMKSAGSQLRSYNYIGDCASAILTVLVCGKSGESYNIANPNSRITIAELAELIANEVGKKVIFKNPTLIDIANQTPITKQVLSSKKLEKLGWAGAFCVKEGIKHTIEILNEGGEC